MSATTRSNRRTSLKRFVCSHSRTGICPAASLKKTIRTGGKHALLLSQSCDVRNPPARPAGRTRDEHDAQVEIERLCDAPQLREGLRAGRRALEALDRLGPQPHVEIELLRSHLAARTRRVRRLRDLEH